MIADVVRSAGRNRADRADGLAGTAIDAGGSVNVVLCIARRNRADGALALTRSAGNAGIRNLICHMYYLRILLPLILSLDETTRNHTATNLSACRSASIIHLK